jgi:hypothetical protein
MCSGAWVERIALLVYTEIVTHGAAVVPIADTAKGIDETADGFGEVGVDLDCL